ncbi:unnamed protein product [Hymenolepis diminuta]|uniref:Uncharacterized protein n=1 Tax=Hymenolepis diminuta TaxID=6216 RepID=A0A3P7BF05_HYMDI|nr:unnamed protein product [Hymenolepis diminuta]
MSEVLYELSAIGSVRFAKRNVGESGSCTVDNEVQVKTKLLKLIEPRQRKSAPYNRYATSFCQGKWEENYNVLLDGLDFTTVTFEGTELVQVVTGNVAGVMQKPYRGNRHAPGTLVTVN